MAFPDEHPDVYGRKAEDIAASYLESRGLKIVDRRYRSPMGEVDLIAREEDTWVFVEVKGRHSDDFMSAAEAVVLAKQRKLVRTALMYMKKLGLLGEAMRFDVVVIEKEIVEWIPDAFESPDDYAI